MDAKTRKTLEAIRLLWNRNVGNDRFMARRMAERLLRSDPARRYYDEIRPFLG